MLTLDDSRYPLLTTVWSEDVSTTEIDRYMDWLQQNLTRAAQERARVVLVADTRKSVGMGAASRAHLNQRMSTMPAEQERAFYACHLVITSPVIAGVLTALRWISVGPLKKILGKLKSFATYDEAIAAAEKLLGGPAPQA